MRWITQLPPCIDYFVRLQALLLLCVWRLVLSKCRHTHITTVFVDMTDLKAVEEAVKNAKNLKMIFTESI